MPPAKSMECLACSASGKLFLGRPIRIWLPALKLSWTHADPPLELSSLRIPNRYDEDWFGLLEREYCRISPLLMWTSTCDPASDEGSFVPSVALKDRDKMFLPTCSQELIVTSNQGDCSETVWTFFLASLSNSFTRTGREA